MSAREELEALGSRILGEVRNQLYLQMHFIGPALFGLSYRMDLSTRTVGTDGAYIRYNPRFLADIYLNEANGAERAYMHMLMHGLFLHMYHKKEYPDGELWDLSCEIAAESVIDGLEVPVLLRVTSDLREEWYAKLNEEISVLTAEKIYRYFTEHPLDGMTQLALEKEFSVDDHSFWEKLPTHKDVPPDKEIPEDINYLPQTNLPLKETWEKMGEQVRIEAERSGSENTNERGRLSRLLRARQVSHADYADLLRQFAVWREEIAVDMDTFDPGYYYYGMEMYGDMPLVEPLEYRESKRIDTLIIAIDTSASTARRHVQKFLDQTVALLSHKESFFSHVDIRLIECDDVVQKEIVLSSLSDLSEYAKGFEIKGGYGTDFRPVFFRVAELLRKKEIKNVKGLVYFTDGHGNYPKQPPPYKSAFCFIEDEDYDDTNVPSWALKVYV